MSHEPTIDTSAALVRGPSGFRNRGVRRFGRPAIVMLLSLLAALASAQTRIQDVIYMKAGGAAFTMDIFKPAKPNKAAVVFMVSGGWVSDHSMIDSFGAAVQKVFTDAGFTVFEVVHGAQPRFRVAEIVEQVRTAVRFIHAHAYDYGIDTNRVGVTGISSGGHLSLMIAGSPDSPVNAVAAIAPPTDLANWGKAGFLLTDEPQMGIFAPALGIDPKAPRSGIETSAKQLSPITYVNPKYPPTLIVHGDSDKVVPLQQAQAMDQALAKAGVEHKLEVIAGGGHDDKTFGPGVVKAVQWFKDKLLKQVVGGSMLREQRCVEDPDLGRAFQTATQRRHELGETWLSDAGIEVGLGRPFFNKHESVGLLYAKEVVAPEATVRLQSSRLVDLARGFRFPDLFRLEMAIGV